MTDPVSLFELPALDVTLEAQEASRTWSRLLRVHDADGTLSVVAVRRDGSFSRFDTLSSPSMAWAEDSRVNAAEVDQDPDLDFAAPHAVDHFMLGDLIGTGGMAVVHEALLPGDETRYAVKLCRPSGSSVVDQVFAIEAAVMGALHHENIVPLVASGEVRGGMRWLAMPHIPGQSLRRLLDRSKSVRGADRESLLRRLLLPAFLQVCAAVEHAHGLGVLHCDLKPSNVMITPAGHAWLLDWGMAKTFAPGAVPPQSGLESPIRDKSVGGTPGYMAPEQIRGRGDRLGPWTDVWSLGSVLYELITGQRAFRRDGRDTVQFFRRVLERPPTRPDLRVLLPPSVLPLGTLCAKAMKQDPGGRPATVREFAGEAQRIVSELGWDPQG